MSQGRVSSMAGGLIGSEILKIAADIRALVSEGAEVCNLTVGDFAPAEFPIPPLLARAIGEALAAGETSYPPSDGVLALRRVVAERSERWCGAPYGVESVLVTGGSRPGIYSTYAALLDPGDTVVYPVPSWNNNHYVHLAGARGVPVQCSPESDFLPTRADLESAVRGARLLALNSPLNPAGTALSAEALGDICDLILEENQRRPAGERPLYLMYDQVYRALLFDGATHVTPVALRPAMREYTIYVDGISKSCAATGLRVGWTVGPADITARMASLLGHIGAWAPRPEQVATARLLEDEAELDAYQKGMNEAVKYRLDLLFAGIQRLREQGLPVEAIAPTGAIYLSARFALHGARTSEGEALETDEAIRRYLLERAGVAVVPFHAFGVQGETGWFRLSVGAVSPAAITATLQRLADALAELDARTAA